MSDLTTRPSQDVTPHITEAVFEQLFQALDRLNQIMEAHADMQRQFAQLVRIHDEYVRLANERYKLIDAFLDPALALQDTLGQIVGAQQRLQTTIENEHAATRTALAIHMATEAPVLQARQREHGRA